MATSTRTIDLPSDDQITALMDACKDNATGQRNRALIDLVRYSGLRVSEALALTLADVQGDGRGNTQLHVRNGKGGKERYTPLWNGAVDELHRWMDIRASLNLPDNAPLFCVVQGKQAGAPLTRAYVDAMIKRLAIDAGFPKRQRIHAHALRHALATELFHLGCTLADIQAQLGHSHAITTQRYLESLGATDLADKINSVLDRKYNAPA